MEHLLLAGGEQYLPFARAIVKRLLATGLRYATQRFILPDATILVAIEPGHERIRIEAKGVALLPMDSGVVDIGAYQEANPATWLAGTLHETTYASGYHANFILQPPDFDPPRLYLNPGVVAGQFAGILEPQGKTGVIGQVPVDAQPAKSFSPGKILDSSTPPVEIDNPADGNLQAKKRIAVLCPASMFTGRARLYAQALYGAHYYDAGGKNTPTIPFALNDIGLGQRPALVLNNRQKSQATVQMTSGSCVYLDPATGKHYLFVFEGGVRCFPLKSSKLGEALRPYLITEDPPEGLESLSAQDRDHLEAYILSQSLPRGTGYDDLGRPYADGLVQARFGMGYSWHWNKQGVAGDCIEHGTYSQGGINFGMSSTWYRASISKTATPGYFRVSEAVLEGPVQWAVYRSAWTITYPDWAEYKQIKLTPKNSVVFAADAPFYVFYLGDDLKVCRVAVQEQPASQYREMSPYFSDHSYYGGEQSSRWTYKFDGGFLEDHSVSSYLEANITCGSISTGFMPFGKTEDNYRLEVSEKEQLSWYPPTSTGMFGSYTVEIGEATVTSSPLTLVPHTWSWSTTSVSGTADGTQTANVRYHFYRGDFDVTWNGRSTAVVPFYDAEAIYLDGLLTKDTSWNRRDQHLETLFGNFADAWGTRTVISGQGYDRFGWQKAGPGMESGINTSILTDTTTTVTASATQASISKMLGHGGEVTATFSNLSVFHDNAAELVDSPMYTVSGTRTSPQGVAIAAGSITAVGAPTAPSVPALVGWV